VSVRILGIVGGTGPESTIDYYRSIVASWRRRSPDGSYPRLIVNSVEAGGVFRLLDQGHYAAVASQLAEAVRQLAAAAPEVRLVSLGRHRLRGVREETELFALAPVQPL